jgi:tRNA 2-(methylsulfanyl)-N6-isopentenyladenosine37 hydroxylase
MTISLAAILDSLPLRSPTGPAWVDAVMADLDHFLADHASCERKAHAAALMIVSRFPEHPDLQEKMIGLAREELEHFEQVFLILRRRKITLGPDAVDQYVKNLLQHVRHPREQHLLDRLLVAAMVEARSCERFCHFAAALPDGELKTFYIAFAQAESSHYPLFINTAKSLFPASEVDRRLEEWLDLESKIMLALPYAATVH